MENDKPIQLQPDQRSITERYVEHSVRFIRENRDQPFFLYLAHMHVHLPHYPPERFLRQSINGPYGAAVECIDWATGAILHELKQQGLDDNTLVIFTSDNGSRADRGGSNGHLRGRKGQCWEGGMRVPCIARWPNQIHAGSTCDQTASAMDFLPTFTQLAGGQTPDDRVIDGHDIRPLLFSQPDATTPYHALFYYRMHELNAVRSGPWKLLVPAMEPPEGGLFNLVDDPGERNNLIADHPDVAQRLNALLDQCRADLGDSRTGHEGANRRPIGHVKNPQPLAYQDDDYPYIVAMYDLPDRG
jgi:arylsulfatase A-like enzyme